MRRLSFLATIALLLSCSHGEPFSSPPHDTDDPFSSIGFPTRLTFNRGKDIDVSWLPDGSGFIYTFEQFRFAEGDWCLALMPATGGRITRTLCETRPGSEDSVNARTRSAVEAGGRLVYVRTANLPNREAAATHELVVATLADPEAVIAWRNGPITLPGTVTHGGLSMPRWLDANTFVYRGDITGLPRACSSCAPDTVISGRDLVLVTLAGGQMTSTVIAGTTYVSSIAVRGSDEVFFTRAGESIVYRWLRSTGAISVAWDFGGGIARGVQIAGNRLVATVGGNVNFDLDSAMQDSVLADFGGFVHIVDLVGGVDGLVDQFNLWRNPALSPDGRRLIVESALRAPDLFLFDLP